MKIRSMRTLILPLALLAAVIALSATASAETLVAFATRTNNDFGTNTHFMQMLDDPGATSLSFNTPRAGRIVKITYNAECGVLGPRQAWVSVSILVDGVEANPKGGADTAFCTATNTANYSWVSAARQSIITLPTAGAHSVQILVDLNNGATNWWLGDTSLVVEVK